MLFKNYRSGLTLIFIIVNVSKYLLLVSSSQLTSTRSSNSKGHTDSSCSINIRGGNIPWASSQNPLSLHSYHTPNKKEKIPYHLGVQGGSVFHNDKDKSSSKNDQIEVQNLVHDLSDNSNVTQNETSTFRTKRSTKSSNFPTYHNTPYLVSSHSIQGQRNYMEDEWFVNQGGTFAAVMDGHGGGAVSRYVKQNLYARYLQAQDKEHIITESISTLKDANNHNIAESFLPKNLVAEDYTNEQDKTCIAYIDHSSTSSITNLKLLSQGISNDSLPPSVHAQMWALKSAFDTVDAEVQKISHWSFQGSTAVAIKLCQAALGQRQAQYLSDNREALLTAKQTNSTNNITTNQTKSIQDMKTFIIAANVGDSRAVLSRSGKAIDLTRDHKPNDPSERKRVESLGGSVDWCGPIHPKTGNPIIKRRSYRHKKVSGKIDRGKICNGVFRINGNLSLSRAIGDRSEKPMVSAEVEIGHLELDYDKDEFVVLGTDGVFDVFDSSQDLINFVHDLLDIPTKSSYILNSEHEKKSDNTLSPEYEIINERRKQMARYIVQEALRRGSMDNISAIVVWLK